MERLRNVLTIRITYRMLLYYGNYVFDQNIWCGEHSLLSGMLLFHEVEHNKP